MATRKTVLSCLLCEGFAKCTRFTRTTAFGRCRLVSNRNRNARAMQWPESHCASNERGTAHACGCVTSPLLVTRCTPCNAHSTSTREYTTCTVALASHTQRCTSFYCSRKTAVGQCTLDVCVRGAAGSGRTSCRRVRQRGATVARPSRTRILARHSTLLYSFSRFCCTHWKELIRSSV